MIEIMTDLESNTFYLQFPYNRQLIEIVKMIDGRKWNPVLKLWEVPASPAYANMIDRTLHDQRYTGDAAFQAMLTKHTEGIAIRHEPTPTFRETCTPCFQHQLLGLDLTLNRDAIYLAWMMGCVDSKTEYLAPDGWHFIDTYKDGPVAQWHHDTNKAEFVHPMQYVNKPCTKMVRFHGARGTDQVLSLDHRVPVINHHTGKYQTTMSARDVVKQLRGAKHAHVCLPVTFTMEFNGPGIPLSDAELRLMVAVMADGHFPAHCRTDRCYLRVKKPRKQKRIVMLLKAAGIEYDRLRDSVPGFRKYAFSAPLKLKQYQMEWLAQMTSAQRDIICDEVFRWDGTIKTGNRGPAFFSKHRSDADFVQTALASKGIIASIFKSNGVYVVNTRGVRRRWYMVSPWNVKPFKPKDGRQYCFEVPSHYLVLRRNGKIFLTGNTGKSKTIVDTAGLLKMQRTLILCPKSVVGEWPRQFITHGHTYGIRCIALARDSVDKRTRVAQKALTMGPTALVINYEAAWMEPFGDWALSQQWDLVVCDEATKIKSGKARVSKFVHKLAAKATKRICLSGTPIPNNPLDLWSQCKFLDVGLFGSSFVAFRSRYSILGGFQNKQVLAFRNLDELNRRFYEIAHRVTKEECLDLPETMDETREIELGADGVRHYKEMEGQFYARVDEGSITLANVLVESVRLQQLTGGVVQYDEKDTTTEIDTSKASALGDIMEDLPQTEPLVVFCRFRPDLDVIHRVAKEHDRVSYEISGRKHQLEEWRSGDPNATVLAVQIQAGGLGIDLTRARYAVYYSQDWSFGVYEQSKSRLHRQGQRNAVTYYHLLALCAGRKTIDHHIYKALAKKGNVATEILTGRPGNP